MFAMLDKSECLCKISNVLFPVRDGGWLRGIGSDILCHTDGNVPVGRQAEC